MGLTGLLVRAEEHLIEPRIERDVENIEPGHVARRSIVVVVQAVGGRQNEVVVVHRTGNAVDHRFQLGGSLDDETKRIHRMIVSRRDLAGADQLDTRR
jgi:hypothetical protein